jgi:hypothetical protein
MARALDDWKNRYYPGHGDEWIRLSVPVNLRNMDDRLWRISAANVVSMVFLDRRQPQRIGPDPLLAGIHEQMQRIKRFQLGLTFLFSLGMFQSLPSGLAGMTQANRCLSTCVFTNLGDPLSHVQLPRSDGRLVAGDLLLEELEVMAPTRPYTCAALAVFQYAGRLCATLNYDPRPVSCGQAEDLLEGFRRQVCHSLNVKRAAA